jgi:hypothetical protein
MNIMLMATAADTRIAARRSPMETKGSTTEIRTSHHQQAAQEADEEV